MNKCSPPSAYCCSNFQPPRSPLKIQREPKAASLLPPERSGAQERPWLRPEFSLRLRLPPVPGCPVGSRPALLGATAAAGPVLTAALCPPPAGPSCSLIRAWDSGRARAVHRGGCSDPPPWYGGAERRSRLARPGLPAAVPAARPRQAGPANGAGGGRCRGSSARPARPRTGPSRARRRPRPAALRPHGQRGPAALHNPGQRRHGQRGCPAPAPTVQASASFSGSRRISKAKQDGAWRSRTRGKRSALLSALRVPSAVGPRLDSRWETGIKTPFVSKVLHCSQYSVWHARAWATRATDSRT